MENSDRNRASASSWSITSQKCKEFISRLWAAARSCRVSVIVKVTEWVFVSSGHFVLTRTDLVTARIVHTCSCRWPASAVGRQLIFIMLNPPTYVFPEPLRHSQFRTFHLCSPYPFQLLGRVYERFKANDHSLVPEISRLRMCIRTTGET